MATRAAATAAVAGGGLMLAATAASAATSAPSVGFSSIPASYTCPTTAFGQGMAPLNMGATISIQTNVTTGTSVTIKLVTNPMTVPTGMATTLPSFTGFGLNGNAAFTGAWTGNTNLTGNMALQTGAGALTTIPSMTAFGHFTPTGNGQAFLAAPTTITINLNGAAQTMAPLTCNLVNPAQTAFNLQNAGTGTTTGTGTGTAAGAQSFTCTITTAAGMNNTMTLPMNLGFSGLNTMGNTGRVWLSGNNFLNQLGLGSNLTMMSGSGSFGLSGAGTGTIPATTGLNGGNLMLAGKWTPQHMGQFRLTAPHRFQMQMRQQQGTTVTVSCMAATPANTMVQVGAADMNSAAAQGVAAGEGTGVGGGAPNTGTGGSLHSGSSTGLLAGGGAALLAGIGIVLYAMRRRSRTAGL